jgi:hypothetical protein
LVHDSSSSGVSEKVFLIDEEVLRVKRHLNGEFAIIGLLGPLKTLKAHLKEISQTN